ncbi:TlpA disulfide reductase family protein [Actinophytocola sp. NPDC049390]|uniref:TlpA disulfide reductase family protein n=1 Tax=Actinophytocola sp. NPDC049390 TaxID=3363894 RepID=UPI00379F14E8
MGRPIRSWALLAVTALLTLTGCGTGTDAVSQGSSFEFVSPGGQTRIFYDPPQTRGTIQGLSGEDLLQEGKQIRLSDYAGKVVVLNIWGSWCGPCRAEMPHLQRVYDQTKDSGVQFLGIDVRDENRSAPQDFVRDRGVTYPSIYDPPGRSLLALKGYPRSVVPSTIVLDRQHRVAAIFLTALLDTDLLPVVQRIAAEPAASEGPSA